MEISLEIIQKVLEAESDAYAELKELIDSPTRLSIEEYCRIVKEHIK